MEKLSSVKPAPGAKKVGDRCSKGLLHVHEDLAKDNSQTFFEGEQSCSVEGHSSTCYNVVRDLTSDFLLGLCDQEGRTIKKHGAKGVLWQLREQEIKFL